MSKTMKDILKEEAERCYMNVKYHCLEQYGDYAEDIKSLKRAIEIDPKNKEYAISLDLIQTAGPERYKIEWKKHYYRKKFKYVYSKKAEIPPRFGTKSWIRASRCDEHWYLSKLEAEAVLITENQVLMLYHIEKHHQKMKKQHPLRLVDKKFDRYELFTKTALKKVGIDVKKHSIPPVKEIRSQQYNKWYQLYHVPELAHISPNCLFTKNKLKKLGLIKEEIEKHLKPICYNIYYIDFEEQELLRPQ